MNMDANTEKWDRYYTGFGTTSFDFDAPPSEYLKVVKSLAGPRTRALEYGCGRGTDSLVLAYEFGIRPTLVDLSEPALELARRYFKKYGLPCETVKADLCALPFDDDAFDLLYSKGSFSNFPDGLRVLSELARVSAPGGRIVMSAVNALRIENLLMNRRRAYFQKSYFPWELDALAKKAGLRIRQRFAYDSFYIPRLKHRAAAEALKNAPLPKRLKLFVGIVAEKK